MGYHYEMGAAFTVAELFGMGAYVMICILAFCISIAMYVLQSWGLYAIAARRQLKNPWLAWLPLGNMWILGSIADQYQYVTTGRTRNRRKVLLGLNIAMGAIAVIMVVAMFASIANVIISIPDVAYMTDRQVLELLLSPLLSLLWFSLLVLVVAVIQWVYEYMALYDLYRSSDPKNSVLYLILSIFLARLLPVFIFLCRNKDEGMPPRRVDPMSQRLPQSPEI